MELVLFFRITQCSSLILFYSTLFSNTRDMRKARCVCISHAHKCANRSIELFAALNGILWVCVCVIFSICLRSTVSTRMFVLQTTCFLRCFALSLLPIAMDVYIVHFYCPFACIVSTPVTITTHTRAKTYKNNSSAKKKRQ